MPTTAISLFLTKQMKYPFSCTSILMLLLIFAIVVIVEEGCYIILMPLLDLEFIRFNLTTSQQKRKTCIKEYKSLKYYGP